MERSRRAVQARGACLLRMRCRVRRCILRRRAVSDTFLPIARRRAGCAPSARDRRSSGPAAAAACRHRCGAGLRRCCRGLPVSEGSRERRPSQPRPLSRYCRSGQHHNTAFGAFGTKFRYEAEAASVLELHVENGERRRCFTDNIDAFGHRPRIHHLETAHFHGPPQARSQRRVVVENEQRIVGQANLPSCRRLFRHQRATRQLYLHFATAILCVPV